MSEVPLYLEVKHKSQSRPDAGLGSQATCLKTFRVVPSLPLPGSETVFVIPRKSASPESIFVIYFRGIYREVRGVWNCLCDSSEV